MKLFTLQQNNYIIFTKIQIHHLKNFLNTYLLQIYKTTIYTNKYLIRKTKHKKYHFLSKLTSHNYQ